MSNTATVITTKAGEALIAQMQAENKVLVIDKFIFANVPNRPAFPNRDDVVPTEHVVHESAVHEQGRLTENSVIYSTTLASNVGPFSFNWSGLFCSEHNVLVAINFPPPVDKTVDAPGITGNTLVRSFVLEYKGIAETTNITVDPSSWQYDAHKRMSKMDNDTAQAIIDQNGKDWFIDDGFIVTPQSSAYSIKAGAGYVSGHRISLDFDRIIQVPEKPAFIYVDAFREGSPTGEWQTKFTFVVAAEEKDDYTDAQSIQHYVCKIAQVFEDGSVGDMRGTNKVNMYANIAKDGSGLNADEMYEPGSFFVLDGSMLNVPTKSRAVLTVIKLKDRFLQTFKTDKGGMYSRYTYNKIYEAWCTDVKQKINKNELEERGFSDGVKVDVINNERKDCEEFFIKKINDSEPIVTSKDIVIVSENLIAARNDVIANTRRSNVEDKINLHFGVMHGNPFRENEVGGLCKYKVTSVVDIGGNFIALSSNAGMVENQTIVYMCNDNTYETNVILNIRPNGVYVKKPIKKQIDVGDNCFNFWDDDAHPNKHGFYAIADYAIDELVFSATTSQTIYPNELSPLTEFDVINILNDDDSEAPGCVNVDYARITSSVSGGCKTLPMRVDAGMHKITGVVNPSVNGDINKLTISVIQQRWEKSGNVISQQVANTKLYVSDCLTYFEFSFNAQDDHNIYLEFKTDADGVFEVGKCDILKITENIHTLNKGTHVLLGDSWFARGFIYNRLQNRLPNATFINSGNSGFASDQLANVFDSQVARYKPDVVWLMCGTNDYFRQYSVDKFSFNMGVIKQRCFDIGANVISFDASVGSKTSREGTQPNNLNLSREYALVSECRRANKKNSNALLVKERIESVTINTMIPPNKEVMVAVFSPTIHDVNLLNSSFKNENGALNVNFGFSVGIDIPEINTVTWREFDLKRPRDNVKLTYSNTGKFPILSIKNKTSEEITAVGSIVIGYYPEV